MSSVQSITVNSKDRTQGSRTLFLIRLKSPVSFNKCSLEEVVLPNSFYNMEDVTIGVNDGAADSADLNGIYTSVSISQALSTQLAGYVTSFNSDLQRFVISHASPFTLTLPDAETARRLGFDSLVNVSVANRVVSDRPPDLQVYKNVLIVIRELSLSNITSSQNSVSYTFKVPVITNRGDYLIYMENNQFFQHIIESECPVRLNDMEVRLIGEDGMQIDESQINDWSFSLRINNNITFVV